MVWYRCILIYSYIQLKVYFENLLIFKNPYTASLSYDDAVTCVTIYNELSIWAYLSTYFKFRISGCIHQIQDFFIVELKYSDMLSQNSSSISYYIYLKYSGTLCVYTYQIFFPECFAEYFWNFPRTDFGK